MAKQKTVTRKKATKKAVAVKPETSESVTKKQMLSFGQRYEIVNFLKANKGRIERDRLTREEVAAELTTMLGANVGTFHLKSLSEVAGVQWSKGARAPVYVRADTQTMMDFALLFQEIFARLRDLLGDTPKLLTQTLENLREDLRKEHAAKAGSVPIGQEDEDDDDDEQDTDG